MGRLVVFDFKLFEIEDNELSEQPDVIVVHHHEGEDESGPDDIFGGKGN
jgi:hypothetical protein